MNSGHGIGSKLGVSAAKIVSKKRLFKSVSSAKVELLKKKQLKKRTFSKVKWAVRAYQEWRECRMQDPNNYNYDSKIFEANLSDLVNLTQDSLQHSLCRFIPEVTKVNEGGEYPGKTLYEMIIGIQKYLTENQIHWKLIDGPEFVNVRTVLDNTMRERAQSNIGMVKKQKLFPWNLRIIYGRMVYLVKIHQTN